MQSTKAKGKNVCNARRSAKFTILSRFVSRNSLSKETNYFLRVQEGTSPEFDIKFGRETLEICSWTSRLYYNSLGGLLGTGMNVHLKENGFVRSVFGLDDREVEQEGPSRGNRFERVRRREKRNFVSFFEIAEFVCFQQLANKTAFKMRTQAMKKTRANKANRREQNIDD